MIEGIDVSHHQRTVSWSACSKVARFAYLRISYGLKGDSTWMDMWHKSHRMLPRGVYQYLLPQQGGRVQAECLVEVMSMVSAAELPPVLDVEEGSPKVEDVKEWLQYVELHLGQTPMIYGSALVLPKLIGHDPFWAKYPLWVADYGRKKGEPRVPLPWSTWDVHQYTDKGSVYGIYGPVDMNVCREDGLIHKLVREWR